MVLFNYLHSNISESIDNEYFGETIFKHLSHDASLYPIKR